ncbi:hypothetical protein IE53DRAFT_239997 [Violaceomyces palustris]|uniref:Uncharacterized protein n=1 Tax=Violaceomyces palustris TaxID=1673888 RepID=A0ACD0P4E9_9BASI|nr:hypothetical protein IE53DRAFT_239997 [Violaceomyces palustris]
MAPFLPSLAASHLLKQNHNQRENDDLDTGAAASAAAAAAGPAWRQFPFFEPQTVRDMSDFSKPPSALGSPNEVAAIVTCPIRPPLQASNANSTLGSGLSSTPLKNGRKADPRASSWEPSVLVGDISGQVRVLDPKLFCELASWDAYSKDGSGGRITHISCDSRGRVVTLGEENGSRFPILRIWDLRVGGKGPGSGSWSPRLLSEGKVQHGSKPNPVAAMTHTPSLSFLSIGLADGTVLLLRGLDSTLMTASTTASVASASASGSKRIPAVALPNFKVVFQPSANSSSGSLQEPVTALGFAEAASSILTQQQTTSSGTAARQNGYAPRKRVPNRQGRNVEGQQSTDKAQVRETGPSTVYLFIVTLSRILRYVVVGKGAGGSPSILDDVGCALGCAAVVPRGSVVQTGVPGGGSAGKMVIAREEAVYIIGSEGREACFAYEGPKARIHVACSQVVIISPPFQASSASASATVRNYVSGGPFSPSSSASRGSPLSNGPPSIKRGMSGNGLPEIAKVTVFDLDNKLVAYSGTFEGGVREAWLGPAGEILVLGDSGALTRLEERPLRAKLDILYRKSLFLLAVNLAKSHAERAGSPEAAARVEALMADIFQRYGDHLYAKGDFEGAMAQYVKTIGYTQPSYVIRKFLDAQRITNLTTYLQELHSRGMASSDHTTLLLNCYTKLKDVASLDKFIKRPAPGPRRPSSPGLDGDHVENGESSDRDELPFDLATAMRVCRQAGYYGHAAYLAKRYNEHDEYLRIQIEDAGDFEDALKYVRSLSPEEAEKNLLQYGKTLLDELPDKTTDLLIELCSGVFVPIDADSPQSLPGGLGSKDSAGRSAAAAYLSYLQVGAYSKGTASSAKTGSSTPNGENGSKRNSASAVEPYKLDRAPRRKGTKSSGPEVSSINAPSMGEPEQADEEKVEAYPKPPPRLFFAHFIQHPQQFTRFLETIALARYGQEVDMDLHAPSHDPLSLENGFKNDLNDEVETTRILMELGIDTDIGSEDPDAADQKSIWNTLLELYLSSSRPDSANVLDGARRQAQREKALHLLEQHDKLPYDITHALVLCSTEKFTEGLILLYERMGMYEDILRHWMDLSIERKYESGNREVDHRNEEGDPGCKVMAALRKYGHMRPHLYPMVLRYLVSEGSILTGHKEDLGSVLSHIESKSLMSPLEVVQALSKTGVASVGLVRDYLTRSIMKEKEETEADTLESQNYNLATNAKLAEILELTDVSTPQVFQSTRCTACGGQMDLPSVHFMCKHSYHQRCLGENDVECPSCARDFGRVQDIRRSNENLSNRHDLFISEIEESKDGFAAVANMYSKGLMGLVHTSELSS